MKISIRHSFCKVTFDNNDKYAGKTLFIDGDRGAEKEFFISKSRLDEMGWLAPTATNPGRCVCVDKNMRDEVLAYVLEKAAKSEYSLVLW